LHFRHIQPCARPLPKLFLTCRQGQIARAQRLNDPILRLTTALFRESNPAPLKYALSLFDLMSPKVRLPLVEPSKEVRTELQTAIAQVCDSYSDEMIGKFGDLALYRRRA
jgi:4-hydroxy-tetrahydrodipicolinate synthase